MKLAKPPENFTRKGAVKALATGVHTTETVQLGRVGGGHVIPVTVGKLEEKKQRATDHHGNLQKNRG